MLVWNTQSTRAVDEAPASLTKFRILGCGRACAMCREPRNSPLVLVSIFNPFAVRWFDFSYLLLSSLLSVKLSLPVPYSRFNLRLVALPIPVKQFSGPKEQRIGIEGTT